jgi:NAD(P)H-dependent flavin oxidoreductase YrpB (nitropropane dioxygenase family)
VSIAPSLPRFAVIETFPAYCPHTDALIGSTSRVVSTAFTRAWAEVQERRYCLEHVEDLQWGELGVEVRQWVDGRWVRAPRNLEAWPALDDGDLPF